MQPAVRPGRGPDKQARAAQESGALAHLNVKPEGHDGDIRTYLTKYAREPVLFKFLFVCLAI
jgi:hypothetical protein